MKRLLFILSILLLTDFAWADDSYIIEIKPTKKILHVDKLGMSDNAGVRDVLEMMPELLTRGSASLLSNYSIQVDGKDVGQARDVVLMQTRLAEVDVIEISTSPTTSEQLNGTGGVINIKLKPVTKEGLSGNVMLDLATMWDVEPSVMLNFRKDKFVLRSSVMMEYYRPTSYLNGSVVEPASTITRQDTSVQSYKQETAKLYMSYQPTDRDELKMHVWETFAMNHFTTNSAWSQMDDVSELYGSSISLFREYQYKKVASSDARKLVAEANVEYTHKYRRGGKFVVEATYNYGNTNHSAFANQEMLNMFGGFARMDTSISLLPHQVLGSAKTKHVLLNPDSPHDLQLELGVNANCSFGQSKISYSTMRGTPTTSDYKTNERSLYLSPYMQWNYTYQRWALQVGTRYQYYSSDVHRDMLINRAQSNDTAVGDNHFVTADVSLGCQVADGHYLRLLAARNIIRKAMIVFGDYAAITKATAGNIIQNEMTVLPVHNVELDYIFNYKTDQHDVLTNFGLQYINTQKQTQTDHVLSVNAQLFYRHSFFSMAFAGNVYVKDERLPDNHNWGFYYNLSWTPVFSFRHQWTLSAKFLYNSKITAMNAEYGDCFFSELRLSKDIGPWNIHAEFSDVFDYKTYDTMHDGLVHSTQIYDMYHRYMLIGAAYKF